MTILQKASDRDGFIYEVIKCILVNVGPMDAKRLQFQLLVCGVWVKKPLLEEILLKMKEKHLIGDPPMKIKPVEKPKIILPGQ